LLLDKHWLNNDNIVTPNYKSISWRQGCSSYKV
jgi:hypothetical protein